MSEYVPGLPRSEEVCLVSDLSQPLEDGRIKVHFSFNNYICDPLCESKSGYTVRKGRYKLLAELVFVLGEEWEWPFIEGLDRHRCVLCDGCRREFLRKFRTLKEIPEFPTHDEIVAGLAKEKEIEREERLERIDRNLARLVEIGEERKDWEEFQAEVAEERRRWKRLIKGMFD